MVTQIMNVARSISSPSCTPASNVRLSARASGFAGNGDFLALSLVAQCIGKSTELIDGMRKNSNQTRFFLPRCRCLFHCTL